MDYECQFPGLVDRPGAQQVRSRPAVRRGRQPADPPTEVAILTNQNGSTDFVSYGSGGRQDRRGVDRQARGLDVVAEVRYPPTTTDWAPIATQVRDAAPDLVINNGLGVDPVNLLQAMAQLNYRPPLMFSLFPAPGPPLGLGATADGLLSVTIFEPNKSTVDKLEPEAAEIVDEFKKRADGGQPALHGVRDAGRGVVDGLGDPRRTRSRAAADSTRRRMCDELHGNGASTTFNGDLTFDPKVNNFWPTTQAIKQIQNADWVTVWPADRAAARPPCSRPGE